MGDSDIVTVDARGHRCPVPTLRLKKAMDALPPGGRARLLATDPMARIDAPHFAAQAGYAVVEIAEEDGVLSVLVAKP